MAVELVHPLGVEEVGRLQSDPMQTEMMRLASAAKLDEVRVL